MDEIISEDSWGPWMPGSLRPVLRGVYHCTLTVKRDNEVERIMDELLVWDGRCFLKGNVSIWSVLNWRQRIEKEGRKVA